MNVDAPRDCALAFARGSRDGLSQSGNLEPSLRVLLVKLTCQRLNFPAVHILLLSCSPRVLKYVTHVAMEMHRSIENHGRIHGEVSYCSSDKFTQESAYGKD